MIAKKPGIAAKPLARSVDDFIGGAAQNAESLPALKFEKVRKKQFPMMIEQPLMDAFDETIARVDEEQRSRSYWIRKLMKKFVEENR